MSSGDPIYLDYNATTPVLPEVLDSVLPYLRELVGNPSSQHVFGRRARAAIETARAQTAALIASEPEEILFTSGGTEANNLAIRGVAAAQGGKGTLVTSTIEHPATAGPCSELQRDGWRLVRLEVDRSGVVQLEALPERGDPHCALMTVMHSNNETGVLQPIAALARKARPGSTLVHTDAAQSVGKVPINVRTLGVDLLSIAGHKLYAPKGVGALFVKRGTKLAPFMLGAGHERGLRPGTENVAGIVALGTACEIAARNLRETATRIGALRERLWQQLSASVPGLQLNGHVEARLPNTLNVRFPGVTGSALLAATPEVAASTGSACHDGRETPSAVLLAMGLTQEKALASVRLTLGRLTTSREIEQAAVALAASWARLRA